MRLAESRKNGSVGFFPAACLLLLTIHSTHAPALVTPPPPPPLSPPFLSSHTTTTPSLPHLLRQVCIDSLSKGVPGFNHQLGTHNLTQR